LEVRGKAAEVRELQLLVDDTRTSIGCVIEKCMLVVQEANKLLREILLIEPIPEHCDLA